MCLLEYWQFIYYALQNDNDKNNIKSFLQLHLIVFIWAFTAILGVLISLSTVHLVWYRMLFASICVGLYIWYKKIKIKVTKEIFIMLFLVGFLIAMHWFAFFKAIEVSNVSVTLACFSSVAFFTSLLEPVFYKRKIIWYEVVFGIIVIGGLYVIFNVERNYVVGIVIALISAFLCALYCVINGKMAKLYSSFTITFYELVGGTFFLTLYMFFTDHFSFKFFMLSKSDWFWLFILGSVCTAYTLISSIKIMRFLSPYTVMLTVNLEPIYGIILAVIFFPNKEKMNFEFYIGALVILSTVIINTILKKSIKQKQ